MTKLNSFYKEILLGKAFATWNDKEKIFEKSDMSEGKTGYTFFVNHLNDIKWHRTDSKTRDQKIEMLKKYKDVILIEDLVVLPAGLRDYVTKDGKSSEDEINPLYRKLLGLTYLLENSDGYSSANDIIRVKIQLVIQEIYTHLFTIQNGKGGFINNAWTKRNIMGGTRNVITASLIKVKDLTTDDALSLNDSIVGLFQYGMGLSTRLDYLIRTTFIDRILGDGSEEYINLVNPKTGKFESVKRDAKYVDKFMSVEGLESELIKKLKILDYTHKPVMVGKNYLCNVYDDGKVFKVLFDNDLPSDRDPKHVRPITLIELISVVLLPTAIDAMGLMTRYPITQQGSIYPTKLRLKPCVNNRKITLLNSAWEDYTTFDTFPIMNEQIYTSMAVHHSKLGNLGGDHDGDKLSLTVLLTKEAIKEAWNLMMSREFYIKPDGSWVNPIENSITGFVLKHITRGLKKLKKIK